NDGNRTIAADAQAVRFGAIDQWFETNKVQFFEPALKVFPALKANGFRSAFRLGLIGAQKYVTAIFFEAERGGDGVHNLLRHSTFGGSGRPWARSAVRKCILATFTRFSALYFATNAFAAASTAAEAPLGSSISYSFS